MIALAYAMGRTLVLPPAKQLYLLDKQHGDVKPELSFENFFDMSAVNAEHKGFNIITTEEFLKRQVSSPKPVLSVLPPQNRTNWDGATDRLFSFLRKNVNNPIWDPNKCIAYFPATSEADAESMQELYQKDILVNRVSKNNNWEKYVGKPPALNASIPERLAEFSAQRERLCLYGSKLQQEPVLHFPADAKDPNDPGSDSRLLVHFYAFLFFENYHQGKSHMQVLDYGDGDLLCV